MPRGGIPIGLEIARALRAPLDLLLVRKIGHPHDEELAIGAIIDGEHPEFVLNPEIAATAGDLAPYLERTKAAALKEIERRRRLYLGGRPALPLAGSTAIVVDDGIATGATMRATLKALRLKSPKRIVLAVPLAPRDTLAALKSEVDEFICLCSPEPFIAIGLYYEDFSPIEDSEVIKLMRAAEATARNVN